MILFDTNVLLRVLLSDRRHPAFGACQELLAAGGFVSDAIMSEVVFNYTLRVKGAIAKEYAASHGDLEIFNKSPRAYTAWFKRLPSGWKHEVYVAFEETWDRLIANYPDVKLVNEELFRSALAIAQKRGHDWPDCLLLAAHEVYGHGVSSVDKDVGCLPDRSNLAQDSGNSSRNKSSTDSKPSLEPEQAGTRPEDLTVVLECDDTKTALAVWKLWEGQFSSTATKVYNVFQACKIKICHLRGRFAYIYCQGSALDVYSAFANWVSLEVSKVAFIGILKGYGVENPFNIELLENAKDFLSETAAYVAARDNLFRGYLSFCDTTKHTYEKIEQVCSVCRIGCERYESESFIAKRLSFWTPRQYPDVEIIPQLSNLSRDYQAHLNASSQGIDGTNMLPRVLLHLLLLEHLELAHTNAPEKLQKLRLS